MTGQFSGRFVNAGLVRHSGAGRLALTLRGPGRWCKISGAIYQFETDSSIYVISCCSSERYLKMMVCCGKWAGQGQPRLRPLQ